MKLPLTATLITFGAIATAISAVPATEAPVPVLLELFTSEGCSSCPPADSLLESLDRQPVANAYLIVLSEHVDYWNYLGWSDPYSSPLFSARQRKYSDRLGASVYTPQLVIDGQSQVLGSDEREVVQAIGVAAQRAKLPLSVHVTGSGSAVGLHVEANSGGKDADLYIVLAADHAQSQVLRGENGGHKLTHVAVAQSVVKIGKWEGKDQVSRDISVPYPRVQASETRVIVLLQDPRSGRILGAAQTGFKKL